MEEKWISSPAKLIDRNKNLWCYYKFLHFSRINFFFLEKSAFEYGGVNHCLAGAMRSLIKDFTVLVCQLEQQHRLGQLRLNQLPFYLQESAHLLAATADLAAALNAGECLGGAVLSLLHDRAKAAVGDAKVYELYRYLMRAVSSQNKPQAGCFWSKLDSLNCQNFCSNPTRIPTVAIFDEFAGTDAHCILD